MALTGWLIPRIPVRRRVGVAVALFAYLAAAIGYPLPASFAEHKDRSQPFPCQDHVCGCQSAEQCWSGCCCLTPEERWAWARSHHVEPPAYAEKPSPKGWRTVRLRDREAASLSEVAAAPSACCARDQSAGCCGGAHSTRGSCCSRNAPVAAETSCCGNAKRRDAADAVPDTGPRPAVGLVLGVSALRCKGLSMLWVGSGVVLSLPGGTRVLHSTLPERLVCHDLTAVRFSHIPPSPPPRLVLD
jgi:hypothetical protein